MGVDKDNGSYDSFSRIPMMATILPKCFTRLPTACTSTSPLVHNDDDEENENEEEVSHDDTLKGKQDQQQQQQSHSSLSSGLSILREALTLSDQKLIEDDDDDDEDEDEDEDEDALIRSAIRLLNQP